MRRTSAGFLALVSSFALIASLSASGEGANPGAAAPAEDSVGGECSVSRSVDGEVQAEIDRLRQEHALKALSQQSGDVIVLNNRGYNYGPPRGLQLDQIRAEARSPK